MNNSASQRPRQNISESRPRKWVWKRVYGTDIPRGYSKYNLYENKEDVEKDNACAFVLGRNGSLWKYYIFIRFKFLNAKKEDITNNLVGEASGSEEAMSQCTKICRKLLHSLHKL